MENIHKQLKGDDLLISTTENSQQLAGELKARSADRHSLLQQLASAKETTNLESLNALAARRDKVIAAQLERSESTLESLKLRQKEETAKIDTFRDVASKLKSQTHEILVALVSIYGTEMAADKSSDYDVYVKPDESSPSVSLWREESFKNKRDELNVSLESSFSSLCSALALLTSTFDARSESKAPSDTSGFCFAVDNPVFNQIELLEGIIPKYANFVRAALAVKRYEQSGFLSMSRCVQQLEHGVIPYLERQFHDRSSTSLAELTRSENALVKELKQLNDLKSEVAEAGIWKEQYCNKMDEQEQIDVELKQARVDLEKLKRRNQPVEDKKAKFEALKLKSSQYKAVIIRPHLQQGAKFIRLCPELTCDIPEFDLLSGEDALTIPVLDLECNFAVLEDQKSIANFQSRHRLILARQNFRSACADKPTFVKTSSEENQERSKENVAIISRPERSDCSVLKSFGDIFDSKQMQLELRRTIRTLQTVRHPNVIRLLGVVKSSENMSNFNFVLILCEIYILKFILEASLCSFF